MNLFFWMIFYNSVHKVQKFQSSSAIVMAGLNLAGGYVESGEEGCRTVPRIPMRLTKQSSSVWELEITLGSFQCLYLRFFINRDHQGILRRIKVDTHDISGFSSKLGIGGNTPTVPPLKLNLVLSENAPDMIFGNISKFFGNQSAGPRGLSAWRLFIEHSQHSFFSVFVVTGRFSGPWLITKAHRFFELRTGCAICSRSLFGYSGFQQSPWLLCLRRPKE